MSSFPLTIFQDEMVRTTNQIQYHGLNICERSIKVYHGLWDTLGSWGVNRKSYRAMSYTYLIIIISDLENAWTWTCKCWLSLAYPMVPPVTMVSPGTHPSLSWNSEGWWPQWSVRRGVYYPKDWGSSNWGIQLWTQSVQEVFHGFSHIFPMKSQ